MPGTKNTRSSRVMTRSAPTRDDPERKRYTAMYRYEGKEISAGIFDTWAEAEAAATTKAAEVVNGRLLPPAKQKLTFREFCKVYRLKRKYKIVNTGRDQLSAINNHLIPKFGDMTMRELENATEEIDRWLTELQFPINEADRAYADYSRRTLRGQMSGLCSKAVSWGYMARNPVRGTEAIANPASKAYAMERWEFDVLHEAMAGEVAKLFLWVAAMSGLRFGELTEIRVSDVHSCDEYAEEGEEYEEEMIYLAVQRTVNDVTNVGQGRFVVKPGTKNYEVRNVDLDPVTTTKILDHIEKHGLERDDLLFTIDMLRAELIDQDSKKIARVIPSDLGRTEPNLLGKTFRHGTTTGYGDGKCRCEWCTYATAEYRRRRRAKGLDLNPGFTGTGRTSANFSRHIPRDYYRLEFMMPAIAKAGIRHVRFHDVRHTHATWLAKSGISLFDLMQRMGHKTMSTTQKYIKMNTRPHRRGGERMAKIMATPARRGLRRLKAG